MKGKIIFGLFIVVAVVQLAMPVGQIRKYEDVLRTGAVYKFRTAPIDPYDAFRGRYVALNYADTTAAFPKDVKLDYGVTSAALPKAEKWEYGTPAYVSLQNDEAGFALFGEISGMRPVHGDYLRVKYTYTDPKTGKAHFQLPFDRFFMEETKAPLAEAAYFKHGNRRDQTIATSYAIVRVKGGRGVIENLYIEDKPIRDFLAEEASKQSRDSANSRKQVE